MNVKHLLFTSLISVALGSYQANAQSPTAPAMGFNIFTRGDFTVNTNEVEGPVAAGGNMFVNGGYQVAIKTKGIYNVDGVSIGLAIGGGLSLKANLKVDNGNYAKIGSGTPNTDNLTNLKVWYTDNNGHDPGGAMRITKEGSGYDGNPNFIINTGPSRFRENYKVSETNNPVFENVFGAGPGQINLDAAFAELIRNSYMLRDLKDNFPIRKENGDVIPGAETGPYSDPSIFQNNPKLKFENKDGINVLTVTAKVWNSIKNFNIDYQDLFATTEQSMTPEAYASSGRKFALVINIIDFPTFCASTGKSEIEFPNMGSLGDERAGMVIFNFPDATKKLILKNSVIFGTILAPQADVTKDNNGNLVGQVIAKSFNHNGHEIHYRPFLPTITKPADPVTTVTATSKCDKNAPYLDYKITGNYDLTGKTAKIEWEYVDETGVPKVIKEDRVTQMTGSILFPGAAVDEKGQGVAWPGWEMVSGGKWQENEDDRTGLLRLPGTAQIKVTVVDPSTTISITFPESTTFCLTTPPGNTLPVTLSSFTAAKENCNVKLNWKVSEASNFSHFVVERSTDAKTFSQLAQINYNESKSEYSYSESPFSAEITPAKHYYYRLQQVDKDETFEYSSIRSIETGGCDARLAVDFYPNPTQDEVFVKSFSPVKRVEIFTLAGKQVFEAIPAANQTEIKVNVQTYAQGLYIVNVVNEEGKYTSKILKK